MEAKLKEKLPRRFASRESDVLDNFHIERDEVTLDFATQNLR